MNTIPATASRTGATTAASPYRLTFAHIVRSEWIKFSTVRSTWWSIGFVAVVAIGFSLMLANSMAAHDMPDLPVKEANQAAVNVIVMSTMLTQLLAIILGAITVTGEYTTGMIRSTFTAAPGRTAALLAKALVVGVTMFLTSIVVITAASLMTTMLPTGALDLSHPESSILPLLGNALYLALVAVIGVGIGFIIRNGPGALAVGFGLLFVLPLLIALLPKPESAEGTHTLAHFLPANAGQSLFNAPMLPQESVLEPLPAVLTLIAWAVVALVGGIAVLKTRDV